MVRQKHICKI